MSVSSVKWKLTSRPDLGHVEWVKRSLGCLFWRHDLHHHGPLVVSSPGDLFKHLPLGIVGIDTLGLDRLLKVELFGSVVRTEVVLMSAVQQRTYLYKDRLSLRIDPFEGVATVGRKVISIGRRVVAQQHGHGVLRLGNLRGKVEPAI